MNLQNVFHNTFASLENRNYRLFFIGQAISVSGTFMQAVAQAWLVLQLSHSGATLGVITALQYIPMLLLGPWGGVLADRYDKLTMQLVTQTIFGFQAILLGILVITGLIHVWMIGILALFFGLVNVVDNPVRQTFVSEMVGDDRLRNAVTLYTILVNVARVLGPVFAALLIATVGIGMCFIVNGISYVAIIALLFALDRKSLNKTPPLTRAKGQLLEGLQYIRNTPLLLNTLIIMAIIGTFTYEFQVILPLVAQYTFHGTASTYALLLSIQGIGAIIGGFMFAGQKKSAAKTLVLSALLFGLSTIVSAVMPTLWATAAVLFVVGFFSVLFLSLGSTILQLESEPKMRGRVMAYWSMAFLGSTAIGGPIIGWVGEHVGPRWGLAFGGAAAVVAAIIGLFTIVDIRKRLTDSEVSQIELTVEEEQRLR